MPKATQAEMEAAANAAAKAFPAWSQTSILARQQVMFKFQHLIKENMVITVLLLLIIKQLKVYISFSMYYLIQFYHIFIQFLR